MTSPGDRHDPLLEDGSAASASAEGDMDLVDAVPGVYQVVDQHVAPRVPVLRRFSMDGGQVYFGQPPPPDPFVEVLRELNEMDGRIRQPLPFAAPVVEEPVLTLALLARARRIWGEMERAANDHIRALWTERFAPAAIPPFPTMPFDPSPHRPRNRAERRLENRKRR
jgi:hypothetical protein